MDRRRFLRLLPITVGGIAVAEAIPFNRVWSFPSKIVIPQRRLTEKFINKEVLRFLANNFEIASTFKDFREVYPMIGATLRVKLPRRYIVHAASAQAE